MKKYNISSFLIAIFLSMVLISNVFGYDPRVDLQYKGGNKRQIGRYGVLIPLYGEQSDLFFTNMFFMHDSKSSLEGNFGLGYRKKVKENFILGVYGFWDIRKIKNLSKKVQQATLGLEYMTSRFESRFNVYIPPNKKYLVKDLGITGFTRDFDPSIGTSQTIVNSNNYEIPLPGFDLEAGGNVLKRLELFGAYYHFTGRKGAKSINGFRVRTAFYLFHWLDLEAEVNRDNVRKWSNYAGVKFTWTFASKNRPYKNSVNDKMTQLAVRDIDIISKNVTTDDEKKTVSDEKEYIPTYLPPEVVAQLADNVVISGNAVFIDMDLFEQALNTRAGAVDELELAAINASGEFEFKPLLNDDGSLNPEVAKNLAPHFKSDVQSTNILRSSPQIRYALLKAKDDNQLDDQLSTIVGVVAGNIDTDRTAWNLEVNKLIRREGVKLYSSNMYAEQTLVYIRGFRPVPMIVTDPTDRTIGLPDNNVVQIRLSNTLIDKIPAAIKQKIIAEGGDLSRLEMYYMLQDVVFDKEITVGTDISAELAKIRYNPNIHNNAPYAQGARSVGGDGTTNAYNIVGHVKSFVMRTNGDTLIAINNGAFERVHTHEADVTGNGELDQTVWSPPNTGIIPTSIYEPDNRTFSTPPAARDAPQGPGAFYSVGIVQGTNKPIVTYHQIGHIDDLRAMGDSLRVGTSTTHPFVTQATTQTMLDTLNFFVSENSLNDNHGTLTEVKRFAALNDMAFINNRFVYAGKR